MKNFRNIFVGLMIISFIVVANIQVVFGEPISAVECAARDSDDCGGAGSCTTASNKPGICRRGNSGDPIRCECFQSCSEAGYNCNSGCCPGTYCDGGTCRENPPPTPAPRCPHPQQLCGQGNLFHDPQCCFHCCDVPGKEYLCQADAACRAPCPGGNLCGYDLNGEPVCCYGACCSIPGIAACALSPACVAPTPEPTRCTKNDDCGDRPNDCCLGGECHYCDSPLPDS